MTVELITTTEAAKILGISITGVSTAIKRGRIKGKKFGRSWMAEKQSVLEYKKSRKPFGSKKQK